MNFDTRTITVDGNTLRIPVPPEQLSNARDIMHHLMHGRTLSVEIKVRQNKRSINANAYLWKVLTNIAVALGSSKEEIYRQMLIRYGSKFHYAVVRPEMVDELEATFNGAVEIVGDVTVQGQNGISPAKQVLCYLGTSTYNSKEFSAFLDSVIGEAEELGIKCLTKDERATMMTEWGGKNAT